MKKKKFVYLRTMFLLALAILPIACHIWETEDCPPLPENERIPVAFAPKLEVEPLTKVGGNNGSDWTAGDPVGVYMIKHASALSVSTILGQADNVLYKADMNGTGVNLIPDTDTIYYPVADTVDFVLYYPYKTGIANFKYPVDLTVQTDQPALDLIYAHETKGFSRSDKAIVPVTFSHRLAKMEFFIGKGIGISSLDKLKLSIRNVAAKTTFDLPSGKLADAGAGGSDTIETFVSPYKTDSMKAEAILLPVADLNNTRLSLFFEIDTLTYVAQLPVEPGQAGLIAGTRYRYAVTLSELGVALTATILPWTDGRGGTIKPTPP